MTGPSYVMPWHSCGKPFSPLNLVLMTWSRIHPADGEIWIGMSIEATFNYTGSKGWNWVGMKCFLCIDFFRPASPDASEGGRDNCNLRYRCTADKQGGLRVWLSCFFFFFNTIRACTSNNAFYPIREYNWIEKELRSGKMPPEHFISMGFWWFLWSVLTSDKVWPTVRGDFCNLDDNVWQSLWMDPSSSFCTFTLRIRAHFRHGVWWSHLGIWRVTATLSALGFS